VRLKDRFTAGLATATMGVYTLILVGATTTVTDAAQSCSTWPTCQGRWFGLGTADLAVVWAHRSLAAAVALLVLGVAIVAWLYDLDRRVKVAMTLAVGLYPIQIGLGAFAATSPSGGVASEAHLTVGLAIFSSLVLALAWNLEHEDVHAPTGTGGAHDTESTEAADPLPFSGIPRLAFAYFRLMKPRLMWLLCLVAAAGMALAAGPALSVRTVVLTLGGGVLAIGASGTFNHVFERDVDRKMSRTSDRPVVQDLIPVRNAVAFGLGLTVLAILVFLQVNALAAILGATAIAYYAVIYTLVLKPNTALNTLIGGVAGALPALIGSAAVTGRVGVAGIALATVIFLWTPAHFYNLALAYKEDYARGGFPMLPVVKGEAVTRKRIVVYLGATLISTAVLGWATPLGLVFAAVAVGLGAVFLWAVIRLNRERDRSAAFRAFHASNAYLGAVLLAVVVDSLVV
jgi:protoheme IX farnesyltransferase